MHNLSITYFSDTVHNNLIKYFTSYLINQTSLQLFVIEMHQFLLKDFKKSYDSYLIILSITLDTIFTFYTN